MFYRFMLFYMAMLLILLKIVMQYYYIKISAFNRSMNKTTLIPRRLISEPKPLQRIVPHTARIFQIIAWNPMQRLSVCLLAHLIKHKNSPLTCCICDEHWIFANVSHLWYNARVFGYCYFTDERVEC